MTPTETDVERRLRADLHARRDGAAPAPADLADRVRARHRSQRRNQTLGALAAVAAVVLVVGGVQLLPDRFQRAPVATPGQPEVGAGDPLALPTRGSLAGDEAWLEGIRSAGWQITGTAAEGLFEPPVEQRRVVYAGDVPGARVALVVGEDTRGRLGAAWFVGDAGAPPEAMDDVVAEPARSYENQALVIQRGSDPGAVLVVVALPGDSISIDAPPVVEASGEVRRERRELPVDGGVAAGRVWSVVAGFGVHVVGPDGSLRTARATMVTVDHDGTEPSSQPDTEPGPDTERDQVDRMMRAVLAEFDLTAEQASPAVLVAGDGPDGRRIVLVGVTFPSGATGAWVLDIETFDDGGWGGDRSELPPAPAGTAVTDRLIAAPVADGYLAIAAPGGAVAAQVLGAGGRVLGEVPLTDGGWIGPVPGGPYPPGTPGPESVRALDAAGATVAEAPVPR